MPCNSFRFLALCLAISAACVLATEEAAAYDEANYDSGEANEIREKSFTWWKGAQEMLHSPTGNVMVQVAKELLKRSTGNSQVRSEAVLSLNLTNLLIIVLLKILIFAAGILGAGHLNGGYGYGYGYNYPRTAARSEHGINFGLHEGEDYLITGFLAAQGSGIDSCLYAAACASPDMAYKYAKAAKALMGGIEKFEGTSVNKPRYNDLILLVEKAANDGLQGMPCNKSVNCDSIL